jgi:hypothetical protein
LGARRRGGVNLALGPAARAARARPGAPREAAARSRGLAALSARPFRLRTAHARAGPRPLPPAQLRGKPGPDDEKESDRELALRFFAIHHMASDAAGAPVFSRRRAAPAAGAGAGGAACLALPGAGPAVPLCGAPPGGAALACVVLA